MKLGWVESDGSSACLDICGIYCSLSIDWGMRGILFARVWRVPSSAHVQSSSWTEMRSSTASASPLQFAAAVWYSSCSSSAPSRHGTALTTVGNPGTDLIPLTAGCIVSASFVPCRGRLAPARGGLAAPSAIDSLRAAAVDGTAALHDSDFVLGQPVLRA